MSRKSWIAVLIAALMVVTLVPMGAGAATGDSESSLPLAVGQFDDDDGNTFEADIEWLYAEGITKGCNPPVNNLYCPDDFVTRGQMAAFLVRALGYTAISGDHFFDDNGSTFEVDINKLATAGVTKGCNPPINNTYCPNDFVTRGQMAAFIVRAFGLTGTGGGAGLVDIAGNTFAADIDKLATAGVTKGCNPPTNNMYCPDDFVTRGQMAAFIRRAKNFTPPPPPLPPCAAAQSIPDAQCKALLALYNATDGANWTNKTNWLTGDACNWAGVTCAGGHVRSLVRPDNNLVGTLPSALGNLPGLRVLDLSDNMLSGQIPGSLGNLSNLQTLDLSSNITPTSGLSGSIPTSFGKLDNLLVLDLNKNRLSGQIPDQLGGLASLQELYLQENNLGGPVKDDLSNLQNLTDLDLEFNNFSGIQAGFWDIATLDELDVSDNNLGGGISTNIGNMTGLTSLDLSNNAMSGTIPQSITMTPLAGAQGEIVLCGQAGGNVWNLGADPGPVADLFLPAPGTNPNPNTGCPA